MITVPAAIVSALRQVVQVSAILHVAGSDLVCLPDERCRSWCYVRRSKTADNLNVVRAAAGGRSCSARRAGAG